MSQCVGRVGDRPHVIARRQVSECESSCRDDRPDPNLDEKVRAAWKIIQFGDVSRARTGAAVAQVQRPRSGHLSGQCRFDLGTVRDVHPSRRLSRARKQATDGTALT